MATSIKLDCQKTCAEHGVNGGQCRGFVSSNGHETWMTPLCNESPAEWWDDAHVPDVVDGKIHCNGHRPL